MFIIIFVPTPNLSVIIPEKNYIYIISVESAPRGSVTILVSILGSSSIDPLHKVL